MMSVDILPSEIPLDASEHFSTALVPYLKTLIHEYDGKAADVDIAGSLNRATIARGGKLMEPHTWLYASLSSAGIATKPRSTSQSSPFVVSASAPTVVPSNPSRKKQVLLFGSGMVAKPFCRTIWDRSEELDLVIASNNIDEASALLSGETRSGLRSTTQVVHVDIGDATKVDALVKRADIVVRCVKALRISERHIFLMVTYSSQS